MAGATLPGTAAPDPRHEDFSVKAERCRRLAAGISDRQAAEALRIMASQYEDHAAALKH